MTLADLWKYIKADDVMLVEPDGQRVEHYENHKYMGSIVNRITSVENKILVYLN
jgi:hypothetical protein